MLAGKGVEHGHHVVNVSANGERVLRAAALYGANASGKSNFVDAIEHARSLIVSGTRGNSTLPWRPFRFSEHQGRPSRFTFTFVVANVVYEYGIEVLPQHIRSEYLFKTVGGDENLMFSREGDGKSSSIEIGDGITSDPTRRGLYESLSSLVRKNQPFLAELNDKRRELHEIGGVVNWFANQLYCIGAESDFSSLEHTLNVDAPLATFITDFLSKVGTGIDDISIDEVPLESDEDWNIFPAVMRDAVKDLLSEDDGDEVTIKVPTGGSLVRRSSDGKICLLRLKAKHRDKVFEFDEESDGTKRLVHLLPALQILANDPGRVFVIDELDRRLHPLLTRKFVFDALHSGSSQLIFTTHETALLDLNLLRTDEVWFVEKSKNGDSCLTRLSEYKVEGLQLEKGYLQGRFRAIPFVGAQHWLAGGLDCAAPS